VAKAAAMETTAEEFLELFKTTVAYEILSGRARGRSRIVSDGELLRCFRAFLLLAQRFCLDRGEEGPDVDELEVNPFAFRQQRLIPLDGRGRLATAAKALPARPIEGVKRMLEPKSIAVLGVSSTSVNVGRIILRNVLECGFPRDHVYVIKPNETEVDGVRCVASINSLPEVVEETLWSGKVRSAIMIPGGVGETEGSEDIAARVRDVITANRKDSDDGPVFVGPNSLGALSRPGGYDTLFIPSTRLDKRWSAPARRVALISQSGAFIVSRMSNLETLDPAFAVSLGNQIDVTVSDALAAIGERGDIDAVGLYTEGFNNLDGLELLRNIAEVTASGKSVVFYKAGRTETGRSAAAGHTASVAGDYDVCQAAAAQAGALVADTFKEFEQLLELCTALHDKPVKGVRVGAISNAGFETVGMADAIQGQRYRVEIPPLSEETNARLAEMLEKHRLAGLVNARNPLDLTPMAPEDVYEAAIRVMLDCNEVDALILGVVPLTAALKTAPEEVEDPASLAQRIPALFAEASKPMIVVVDSGPRYDPLVRQLRLAGVPVFPSADQAVRSLGRYLCHRAGDTESARTGEKTQEVVVAP
jgi:acyl-CoA synthetase (NDP forming)